MDAAVLTRVVTAVLHRAAYGIGVLGGTLIGTGLAFIPFLSTHLVIGLLLTVASYCTSVITCAIDVPERETDRRIA